MNVVLVMVWGSLGVLEVVLDDVCVCVCFVYVKCLWKTAVFSVL